MADKPKSNLPAQKAKSLPVVPRPATQPSDVVPFAANPQPPLENARSAKTFDTGENGAKTSSPAPIVTAAPEVAKQVAAVEPAAKIAVVAPTGKPAAAIELPAKAAAIAPAGKTSAVEPKARMAGEERTIAADKPAPQGVVDPVVTAPAMKPAVKSATAEPAPKTFAVEQTPRTPAAQPAAKIAAVEPATKLAPSGIPTLIPVGEETVNETYTKIEDNGQNFAAKAATGVKSAMEKGTQGIGELVEFSKGNLEAAVASSRVAAAGVQEMATHAVAYGRTSMEQAKSSAQRFAAVKTPTELFQLQSELVKSSFQTFTAEAVKFGENYMKLLGDIVQPLQSRYELGVEKVKTTVGA